ncbi:MAG TPA: formate transporter FocA [Bellilinea sp.]|nr:formate transporter FocA [Bellilinea sp.]
MNNEDSLSLDALVPPAMAEKAEQVGIRKANADFLTLAVLGLLAGAFVALGAIFATTITAGAQGILPYGVIRLLSGLAFTLGLILVIVGGAELFTGNMLVIMAFANRKISFGLVMRNWLIVYGSNFVGSVATAAIIFVSKQHTFGNGAIGLTMLNTAESKTSLGFIEALALGILCNTLVCLAVWLTYSARSTTDKILAIIPPVAAFVAAGFEHSVANMYFIPVGLMVKQWGSASFFEVIQRTPTDFPHLTLGNFLIGNLLPVTIGNIIGGAVMVGLVYWFVYLRKSSAVKG